MGCSLKFSSKHPIQVEYSTDAGNNWLPIISSCSKINNANCFGTNDATFYAGFSEKWRRITIPLSHLHLFGFVYLR